MVLNGTPDEVLEQAAEWRDCGVRYFVLVTPLHAAQPAQRGSPRPAPFAKIVRGLKKL